jgi:hypothetical protein
VDRNRIDGAARGRFEGFDSYQGRLKIDSQRLELRHSIKLVEIFLAGKCKDITIDKCQDDNDNNTSCIRPKSKVTPWVRLLC